VQAAVFIVSIYAVKVNLHDLLEVDTKDYLDLFSTVEHEISCGKVPAASVRLHFIRHDAGGLILVGFKTEGLSRCVWSHSVRMKKEELSPKHLSLVSHPAQHRQLPHSRTHQVSLANVSMWTDIPRRFS
jgi:hypothetical protein